MLQVRMRAFHLKHTMLSKSLNRLQEISELNKAVCLIQMNIKV